MSLSSFLRFGRFWRFRSLESRIATLILILILLIQIASFGVIRFSISQNARVAVREELSTGARIFNRLLAQNARELSENARFLTVDHDFRQALLEHQADRALVMLARRGLHAGSSLSMMLSDDGRIELSTQGNAQLDTAHAARKLIPQIEAGGSNATLVLIGRQPYQIVAEAVADTRLTKWIVMSMPIGEDMSSLMHDISSLQVVMFTRDGSGVHRVASTFLPGSTDIILDRIQTLRDFGVPRFDLTIGDNEYGAHIVQIEDGTNGQVYVLLARSLDAAIVPFQNLQVTLLVLTIIAIFLAIFGSIVTARKINQPLSELAEEARRISAGDVETPIACTRDDEIGNLALALEDMRSAVARRSHEIRQLAYWDNLTGLPNRLQFGEQLRSAIAGSEQHGERCSVLLMDIDRFKTINDVLGHDSGDLLLQQFAQRLSKLAAHTQDVVARLGGDEFALLLRPGDTSDAIAMAQKIVCMQEEPFSVGDQAVDLSSAIGIAIYPLHASNEEELLGASEVAMYAAKRERQSYAVYAPAMDTASKQSLSLLGQLRMAFERCEFRLYVQPKFSFSTGRVEGVETLIRWAHPTRGLVMPEEFIPFAEQTGYIRLLSYWVLQRAMMLCQMLDRVGQPLKISVNLSPRDLLDHALCERIAELLERHQVSTTSFCFELTESAIMDDPKRAHQTLDKLSQMGFDLAIDDFGTGYSSLAYLKNLPVNELKIDQSFVRNMERNPDDVKIVRSTIDLGHNLGLRVVAEGVESPGIWHLLDTLGCDLAQGYLSGAAIPSEQLIDQLPLWDGIVPSRSA